MNPRPRRRLFSLFRTLTIIAALLQPGAVAAAGADDAAHETENVNAVVKGIIAADNAGDLDKALSFYADDAVLIAPSGDDVVGKDNIRAHYEALFAENALSIDNDIDETIVSGDWAISRGVNHVVATARSGGAQIAATSKYLMTLRRDDENKWRIVHLMWANQPVGAE